MTSLSPGVLFQSTGLNRMSTPIAPAATPVEIEKVHKKDRSRTRKKQTRPKEPYNGHPWPRDSPVAMVYDVGNSSTSMILLNNRNKSSSRLRGQGPLSKGAVNEYGEAEINPDRHFAQSNLNRDYHNPCLNSQSPYYEPESQPHVEWTNKQKRPPWKPGDSPVNTYRHASCRQPTDPIYYSLEHQRPRTTPGSRRPRRDPKSVENNYYLHHPELSFGQRLYLWSTAHVYSLTDMKSLKQKQYLDLLRRERSRGFHSDKEYRQYDKFIRTPRRLTSDDYYRDRDRAESRRARTAQGRLQKELEEEEEEKPQCEDQQKPSRGNSAKNVSFDKKKKEKEESEKEIVKEEDKDAENPPDSNRQKSSSTTSLKRDSKSASSKRSSAKGSRASSRASKASRDKVSGKSEELILSSDPDVSDKKGDGPTHVNVDVGSANMSLSQEPVDREPKDADKLEY